MRLLRFVFLLLLGLRRLECTLGGLPVGFALTCAQADKCRTLLEIFSADAGLVDSRLGRVSKVLQLCVFDQVGCVAAVE